jgi:hypothetical protein
MNKVQGKIVPAAMILGGVALIYFGYKKWS